MKFLANENFPFSSVIKLRQLGYEVESISETLASVSDKVVLQNAVANRQVILTFDKDYGHLIFKEKFPSPTGVLFFRFNPSYPEESFDIFMKFFSKDITQIEGWFIVVEREMIRKRKL